MQENGRVALIILVYPFALMVAAAALNLLLLGVAPLHIALPEAPQLQPMLIAALMVLGGHVWLMTSTELTRLKYGLFATPEEWAARGLDPQNASLEGQRELERRHNAHRNLTENTVYFAIFAALFLLVTPSAMAGWVWPIGFAVGRLGHCYSYLSGRDGLRGLFMSLSLLSLFGVASYLVILLLV